MKISVKHFAASESQLSFDELMEKGKSTLIAKDTVKKIEYWFDPKTSVIYGYDHGKTTAPVSEYGVKDQDYLDGIVDMLSYNKNIKFV
jgi:hypothetical protein